MLDVAANALRLTGRRILVTGAASGIGRATTELFRRHGATLAVTDVQVDLLTEVADCTDSLALPADLLETGSLSRVVDTAAQSMGGLDGLVNCAGISDLTPFAALDLAVWERMLAVNLTAPFALCHAAVPWLRQNPGATIVNVASGTGILPDKANATAYGASKGGLITFSKALAAELAPDVRVNVVCPGVTRTAMTEALLPLDPEDDVDSAFVQRYALKRVAEPLEIAAGVLFLTSHESSFTTGITLAIDGGRTYH